MLHWGSLARRAVPQLVLVVLLAAVLPAPAASAGNDAMLLLRFRDTFDNGASVLSDWHGDDPCAGRWSGVGCNNGQVTKIIIEERGLQGYIPPNFWALPASLRVLDLHGNSIAGSLSRLESLPALAWLDLAGCLLHGTLPALPPALKYLGLSSNKLTGQLPELPATLQGLDAYENHFSGSLPALPPRLERLDLSANHLEGPLPEALPAALRALHVMHNNLTGPIPEGWAKLPEPLVELDVAENQLSGAVPRKWRLNKALRILKLNRNSLSGKPAEWVLPADLQFLWVQQNQFSGSFPRLAELAGLEEARLYDNLFAGRLPVTEATSKAVVAALPGNLGLCGAAPRSPNYVSYEPITQAFEALLPLPDCPPTSYSLIFGAGAAFGVLAAVVVVSLGGYGRSSSGSSSPRGSRCRPGGWRAGLRRVCRVLTRTQSSSKLQLLGAAGADYDERLAAVEGSGLKRRRSRRWFVRDSCPSPDYDSALELNGGVVESEFYVHDDHLMALDSAESGEIVAAMRDTIPAVLSSRRLSGSMPGLEGFGLSSARHTGGINCRF